MELYTYFRSSAAYRVRIALALKGLPFEPHYVSLPKSEHHAPEFRAVNPQALVPALVTDGAVLIQSLAIIEYLEETHPLPPLLPKTPIDRAYVRAVAQIVSAEIHPLNNLRTLKYIRKSYGLDEEGVNEWYRHWIAEGFAMLERYLAATQKAGRYAFADSVSMADCCIVPQVFNAQRFQCDLAPYPTLMRIFAACMEDDAFAATQPSKQGDATT